MGVREVIVDRHGAAVDGLGGLIGVAKPVSYTHLIVDVGVGRKLGAGAHKALEDHDVRLVGDGTGVEGDPS